MSRKTVVFVNPDGSTVTTYIELCPIERDIDWLYEQPRPDAEVPLWGAESDPDALGAPE